MKLSILIPMYNAEKYISNCLDSLLRQNLSHSDYEIIIIDDGSQDNSVAIVNAYITEYKNIILYEEPNSGTYTTRNKLLKLARGEYIYNLDSDDYIVHDCLGDLLKMAKGNNLDILGFKTIETEDLNHFDLDTTIKSSELEIYNGKKFIANHKKLRYEIWWYFIKKDFLLEHNMSFSNNEYCADVIFTLEALLKAENIGYLPLCIHRYVQTENSLMRSQDFDIIRKRMEYLQMMILNKSELIKTVNSPHSITEDKLIDNLVYRRDVVTFFNIINLFRNRFSVTYIKSHIKSYKDVDAFPIHNFIGRKYNSVFHKSLLFMINRPFLVYPLIHFKNAFIKTKI